MARQLRPQDNQNRLDRLLWDGKIEAVRRMLSLVPADYRALAEARLALPLHAPAADLLVARVPAPLQADSGLLFDGVALRGAKRT